VTIYRDGSKDRQVLSVNRGKKEAKAVVKERPETLQGFTTKIKTGLGDLYVTVTEMDGLPFEVFATIGKSGRSTTAKTEAIGRLISLALRSGIKVEKVVEQLKGIGGEHPIFQNGGIVRSIPDAISQVLENRYLGGKNGKTNGFEKDMMGATCPECEEPLSFEEGCMLCHFCGYSKCS
jgi:ribonucleoside-diphosphate reductase alpha chain